MGNNSIIPHPLSPHNKFEFINKYKWAYHGRIYVKKITHSIEKFITKQLVFFGNLKSCNYLERNVPNGKKCQGWH